MGGMVGGLPHAHPQGHPQGHPHSHAQQMQQPMHSAGPQHPQHLPHQQSPHQQEPSLEGQENRSAAAPMVYGAVVNGSFSMPFLSTGGGPGSDTNSGSNPAKRQRTQEDAKPMLEVIF